MTIRTAGQNLQVPEIMELPQLKILQLHFNNFTGPLALQYHRLTRLDLHYNSRSNGSGGSTAPLRRTPAKKVTGNELFEAQ